MSRVPLLAFSLLLVLFGFHAVHSRITAQAAPSAEEGVLYADLTRAYRLVEPTHKWFCSTNGWLYISSSGVASEAITCTSPAGNDLSWGGGPVTNLKRTGNEISFDRSNAIFGKTPDGCHITATSSADGLKGTQTCNMKYTSPFDAKRTAEAIVSGQWEAHRATFKELSPTDCRQERNLRRQSMASAALILFENQTQQPLTIFSLDANGRRVTPGTTVAPGHSEAEGVPATVPVVVAGPDGACKSIYIPTTDAAKVLLR